MHRDRTISTREVSVSEPDHVTGLPVGLLVSEVTPAPAPERVVLQGRYCRLEPLDPDRHAADLYRASTPPDTAERHRYLFDEPPESEQTFRIWLAAKSTSLDPLFFAVTDQVTGRTLGRQTLMRIDRAHRVIEIGSIYWGPEMSRTRLATEAQFLFAEYVFRLGYRRYEWKCDALNSPSRRAAERFGFSFEGIFRQHMIVKGRNRDTAWYAMIDTEWPALKAAYERWLDPGNFDAAGRELQKLGTLTAAALNR